MSLLFRARTVCELCPFVACRVRESNLTPIISKSGKREKIADLGQDSNALLQGSQPLLLEVSLARASTACKARETRCCSWLATSFKQDGQISRSGPGCAQSCREASSQTQPRAQRSSARSTNIAPGHKRARATDSETRVENDTGPDDQEELKGLQLEVANVKRIKEDYVRKHPDQRNFVRGFEDRNDAAGPSSKPLISAQTAIAHPHTQDAAPSMKARDPKWSIYYDPIFNPYGAPPPGMPYLEKSHAQLIAEGLLDAAKPPPLPEETPDFSGSDQDSDDSSVDEDLKDIVMPNGPPPIRYDLGHTPTQEHQLPTLADSEATSACKEGEDRIATGTNTEEVVERSTASTTRSTTACRPSSRHRYKYQSQQI